VIGQHFEVEISPTNRFVLLLCSLVGFVKVDWNSGLRKPVRAMPHAHSVMIIFSERFQDNFRVKARSTPEYYDEVVKNSDPLEGPRPAHRMTPSNSARPLGLTLLQLVTAVLRL